jgi:hypothetical protein
MVVVHRDLLPGSDCGGDTRYHRAQYKFGFHDCGPFFDFEE